MRRGEMVGLAALAVVGGVGCGSDSGFKPIPEDTGIIPGGDDPCDDIEVDGCMEAEYTVDSPALEVAGICSLIYDPTEHGMGDTVRFDDLTGFAIVGEDVPDPAGLEIKLAFDQDKWNPTNTWPLATDTYRSNAVEVVTIGEDCWRAKTVTTDDLGTLRECESESTDGSCEVDLLVVEIADATRASEGRCDEYVRGDLSICLYGRSPLEVLPTVATSPRFDPGTTCQAGSGQFMLIPIQTVNLDGDDRSTSLMRPVMISGTGALTATSRILSIQPRARWRQPVKLLRGDRERWRVGHDDRLQSIGDSVVVLNGAGASFPDGDVVGSSTFVVEEHLSTRAPLTTVSMEWRCGEPTLAQLHDEDEGFQATTYGTTLSELGCIGGWAQRIGVQVNEDADRRWITLSPFGMPDLQVSSRLVLRSGVERFTGSRDGIRVTGAVLSESTAKGLVLRLDSVLYQGQELCTAGIYLLQAG